MFKLRPLASLPTTTLPWLSLRDHFVATVGPHSGSGSPRGPLLVLADATFTPRSRFPLHPHRDMEILSIVLDGELSHHGDQAHGAVMPTRSVQLISSRDGIVHAEGNDTDAPCRMLQVWFRPDTLGGAPAYYQRDLSTLARQQVAGDAQMPLRCDAQVWWFDLAPGTGERVSVASRRHGYLLAIDTELHTAAGVLAAGEGLEIDGGELILTSPGGGAALWIDVPQTEA